MGTFEWILIVVGAIAFTSGFCDWRHRKEMEEWLVVMNSALRRMMEVEKELAELKGEPEEANMFRMIEEALGEIDHS